jgi:hypothetical protein
VVIERFCDGLSAAYSESRSKPVFVLSESRLSPAKADELQSRLQDIMDWLNQTPEDPNGVPVSVLLGFYIQESR